MPGRLLLGFWIHLDERSCSSVQSHRDSPQPSDAGMDSRSSRTLHHADSELVVPASPPVSPRPQAGNQRLRHAASFLAAGWRLTRRELRANSTPRACLPRLVQRQQPPAAKFMEARDANFDVSLRFETASRRTRMINSCTSSCSCVLPESSTCVTFSGLRSLGKREQGSLNSGTPDRPGTGGRNVDSAKCRGLHAGLRSHIRDRNVPRAS